MKPFQVTLGFLAATIVLAILACGSQTYSTPTDQVAGKEANQVPTASAPSDPVISKDTNQVAAVKAGVQPAWSNEGDQSEKLLVTLRSSRAQWTPERPRL